jgi:hypothetical protein
VIAKKYLVENYDCLELISKYEEGYYDRQSFLQLVVPIAEVSIDKNHHHLVTGHAGTDGIEFCLRIHNQGVWVFYPIETRFHKVSDSISQLITGWTNGSIKV